MLQVEMNKKAAGSKGGTGGMSRRRLLKGAGFAGAGIGASALSGCVEEAIGSGGLKIGVLQPYSGSQPWGTKSTWGFLSGLSRVYGESLTFQPETSWAGADNLVYEPEDEDRTYEFIFRDTVFDPQNAEAAAEALVLDEGVDILFGVTDTSGVPRVIEQVAKPTDTLYVTGGTSGVGVTGDPDFCGKKVFRASEHLGMDAHALSKYIGEETDIETSYVLAVDNRLGRSGVSEYRKALDENGVDVVGDRLLPAGFGEFRDVFVDIDDETESVVLVFSARTIQNVLSTFAEGNATGTFDIRGYGTFGGEFVLNLVSGGLRTGLDELTAESIDKEANLGALVSRYHWNQYDNPINDDFISDFLEAYDTLPALFSGGTYAAGSAIAQAVEETGSQDPDDIAEAMYGMTVEETPKGEGGYVFQEHNNQAKSAMTVANLVPNEEENWGSSLMPSEPIITVDADEVAMPVDDPDMACDLR